MKRFLLVISMLMIAFGGVSAVAAQVATSATEEQVLTVAEDDNWSYAKNADGEPVESMVPMVIDGVPQLEFAPVVLDLYERHQMVSGYAWSADLQAEYYEPVSTTIEIRVLTFADEQNAVEFLNEFYGQLVELSGPSANVAAIDPMPETDLNMLGITSMVEFTSYTSAESQGSAGSVRYLAQIGSTVVSVQVTGPFVDYNFDVAFWLLDAQASCIESGADCEPVAMPNGDGRWQLTERGIVFLTEGDVGNDWARWIFPLENPVPAPEWSVTIP